MDKEFMRLAIDLAKNGKGKVNPNPLVGAVIVKEGRVIGQGYHEEYGKAHAEVNAFNSLRESAEGATIYVTLEPCSHYGKTPPCVDKIIESKISKVVIGTLDPNPLVAGRGVRKLRDSGIDVVVGILEEECKNLAEVFMKYIVTKRPFVVLKTAMTLDGKIATKTGESKWITCDESRKNVHKLRNELSAIMIGVNTVIKDNPELTCRLNYGRNPIRVIVDSKLRIPMTSRVVNDNLARTIIATTDKRDNNKAKELEEKGIEVVKVKAKYDRVDLNELMIKLGELNIDSVLLEGGGTLSFSALEEGIIDKVQAYISPKIIGGEMSKTPVEGNGVEELNKAILLENMTTENVGEDILIQGYIKRGEN
ncbi:bifunctional diaminohydroxyphosphoribosylaminopyrimidine deaminase/5-amino-6-(5-phosphoribosylamino)uracil reductase RibD [Clostridium sp. NSJ-6]|uniref:Riboflavin biosynthesis protein RibD n=1 Tax=Clostridium hominis TaxID=2763036 RepID=A0ABR7DCS7_9CLOT|nr:bifunctional diaminohydroxyphosphoribosylaminopyrimidine deaminase/5-amino-6-(5-phosphoribosylamino)uracil reductase RibD [Clostridium hominis]MBC5629194.1 bifunctional diaminohydroxyphosphoribosylaminopyrimidine deaminase/5-amino-6-(5-phosphoribosylamino)uracil reductase RibD [Clostridium hominis]SCI89976.1 Riboflavin biosynthesis protein RibD [uncultured Clostridium sp.]